MEAREEVTVQCPYCWESIEVLVDPSDLGQAYIEDCQVCCRPIEFTVDEDMQGKPRISVQHEND